MTKRSPIINPEEPDNSVRAEKIDPSLITAGKIDAKSLVANNIIFDIDKHTRDRHGPTVNPRSSSQGLYQPIKPTWRQQ